MVIFFNFYYDNYIDSWKNENYIEFNYNNLIINVLYLHPLDDNNK
jgi:hypothetical protein